MPAYPGFLGPSYQSASYMADAERLINFYLEPTESPSAPSQYALIPTPGFSVFAAVAQAPIRAIGLAGSRVFFIAGFALHELFANGTTILRGTVASDRNPATITWDGPTGGHLFITSGGIGYGYDLNTNTLTANVTALPATMGAFLSDRFLALDATTSTLQASNQLSTTFNPLLIAVRSAEADPWISMTVVHNEIWLFGSLTTEVWYDAGASPFPFQPIAGAFLEQGIAAPFSATRDASPLQWIGQNTQGARVVWQANGYIPQRVSTHGIEAQLSTMSTVSDAISFTYQDRGHLLWCPVFPTADQAFHYDIPLGNAGWAERLFWNTQTGTWNALRVGFHVYAFDQHLVGDRQTGTIFTMSPSVYTDVNGAALRRMRQPPRLSVEQKRVRFNRLQLTMDVGQGLISGQGSDPQVMLRSSNDGGQTWAMERWASAGPIGAYGTRVFWTRLGSGRNRVDQLTFSDPVPFRVVDASIEYEVGIS